MVNLPQLFILAKTPGSNFICDLIVGHVVYCIITIRGALNLLDNVGFMRRQRWEVYSWRTRQQTCDNYRSAGDWETKMATDL